MALSDDKIKFLAAKLSFRTDADGFQYKTTQNNIDDMFEEGYLYPVPNDGKYFDAHGISKGSFREQIETLNNILTGGISKDKTLYTAPYDLPTELRAGVGAAVGTAGGAAYKDGLFVLVSGYNKTIQNDGVKYVVINKPLYPFIKELEQAYKSVKFVKMSEFPKEAERDKNEYMAKFMEIARTNNVYYDKGKNKLVFSSKSQAGADISLIKVKEVFGNRISETGEKDGLKYYAATPTKSELELMTGSVNQNNIIMQNIGNRTIN